MKSKNFPTDTPRAHLSVDSFLNYTDAFFSNASLESAKWEFNPTDLNTISST
jgi:hypothetical protein